MGNRDSSNNSTCFKLLCPCVSLFVLVGAIVGFVALGKSFVEVPPGDVGIVVTRGNLRTVGPGRHQVRPFASDLDLMSTKTQLLEQGHSIPTKEGLNVQLDTAVSYHLDSEKAEEVYKSVGTKYEDVLIKPAVASALRSLTVVSEAKALYTDGRDVIQSQLGEKLTESLAPRGIVVEKVFLKGIILPDQLRKSIEMKAQAEQDAERMDYELEKEKKKAEQDAALMMLQAEQDAKRMDYELEKDKKQAEQDAALMEYTLQQERKEAERKAIEAQGIADFQSIVSDGISENLLKWKGIEATEKLGDSDNAKMVIMGGGGGGGLPVILNGGN